MPPRETRNVTPQPAGSAGTAAPSPALPAVTEAPEPPAERSAAPVSAELARVQSERALATFDNPFESVAAYRHAKQIAEDFARSQFVPKAFQGKVGDCLIAMNMAMRMREDPLMVMQSLMVIGGNPGFKTAFMIARANRLAGFKSSIRWEIRELTPAKLKAKAEDGGYELPNLEVRAYAIDKHGDLIDAKVTTEMAIAEGWPRNAKYRTMPQHMLQWRAAAFLVRLYAPEVLMGFTTSEEVEDLALSRAVAVEAVGSHSRAMALADRLAAENAPVPGEVPLHSPPADRGEVASPAETAPPTPQAGAQATIAT